MPNPIRNRANCRPLRKRRRRPPLRSKATPTSVNPWVTAIRHPTRAPSFRDPVAPAPPRLRTGLTLPKAGDRIDDFDILQRARQRGLRHGVPGPANLARPAGGARRCPPTAAARPAPWPAWSTITSSAFFPRLSSRERNLRLVCMQFVAGTTLEKVIRMLGRPRPPSTWSGQAILEAIDTLSTHAGRVRPGRLARPRAAHGLRFRGGGLLDRRRVWPMPWPMPTTRACCTATSSRPTSS